MKAIRPEIQTVLSRLRRWIRRYILLEGIALTVVLACVLFWLTLGMDLAYFRISRLELPQWFRTFCTIGMLALLFGTVFVWVGLRLFRRMDQADLALTLERRFPELNDRLITAVEMSRRPGSQVQAAMVEQVSEEAARRLSGLPLKETFNPTPLKRLLLACGILLVSLLGLGMTNAQAMERWYEAYILGRDNYWEPFRRNDLKIHVLAQPGDRLREFDHNGIYKHPRGEDLQLVASVPESAQAPERVNLQFVGYGPNGQRRGQVSMSRMSDGEFHHTFNRMVNDHQLWIRGGDYVNREPLRIRVVDPPRVDSITLKCDYPTYTGMDALEDRVVQVAGMQVDLPMETNFQLRATSNKPLLQARIRSPRFELSFGFDKPGNGQQALPTRLTLIDSAAAALRTLELPESPEALLQAGHRGFQIPCVVTAKADERLKAITEGSVFPLPIAADETLQLILYDTDEIESPEPATLAINGIADRPPVVETRRTGVGIAITRMANIPVEGRITDDYGVADAWFVYQTNLQAEEQKRPLITEPSGQKEFRLGQGEPAVERFNLIPLELMDGQTLILGVYATDADNLNGPHVAHGELFTFQIVSQDELLARLFDREVSLRARFEQIRAEMEDLRKTFQKTRQQFPAPGQKNSESDAAAGNPGAGKPGESVQVALAYVDRALHQVRKNHTESRSIETSFQDLREEMVNNRVDTAELLERIDRRIIEPLSLLNQGEFLDVDRRLGALRLVLDRQGDAGADADAVLASMDRLLAQMDLILAEMRDRGTINDLIQSLQDIIQREKKLLDQVEEKRIEDSFFSPLK